MTVRHRLGRIAAIGVLVALLPGAAQAQEGLRTPTIAASAAAAADWATTYYALRNFHVRELNPVLRPMQARPGPMVSMGALMDAGIVSTWNLSVGRHHPRVAVTGLWAMTAFRAYLAIHNLRNTRRAARRAVPATLDAAVTCAGPVIAPACGASGRTAQ